MRHRVKQRSYIAFKLRAEWPASVKLQSRVDERYEFAKDVGHAVAKHVYDMLPEEGAADAVKVTEIELVIMTAETFKRLTSRAT